jgi:hypothetical protein
MAHELDASTLRVYVYDHILKRGLPPTSQEIGDHFRTSKASVLDLLRNAGAGKTLLPHPRTGEIWMAGPFASEETDFVVRGSTQRWFGNCAWDMLGIAAIVAEPVAITTHCPDCAEPFQVAARAPDTITADPGLVVHVLVPARQWYDDVGFT